MQFRLFLVFKKEQDIPGEIMTLNSLFIRLTFCQFYTASSYRYGDLSVIQIFYDLG